MSTTKPKEAKHMYKEKRNRPSSSVKRIQNESLNKYMLNGMNKNEKDSAKLNNIFEPKRDRGIKG